MNNKGSRELSNPLRHARDNSGAGLHDGNVSQNLKPCRTQRDHIASQQLSNNPQFDGINVSNLVVSPETAVLAITVHYVKINIPQSIRMQVQAIY